MTPSYTRLGRRAADVRTVQAATALIEDLNASLERALSTEPRPGERLRMLRETTNQVTRVANDAIQAYRRARSTIDTELRLPHGDVEEAQEMGLLLDRARADVLAVLEVASRRYSWASWPPSVAADGTGRTARTQP